MFGKGDYLRQHVRASIINEHIIPGPVDISGREEGGVTGEGEGGRVSGEIGETSKGQRHY